MNYFFMSLGPLFDAYLGAAVGADATMKVLDYINICRSKLVCFAYLLSCLVFRLH
jgi:hypothetical protein